MEPEIHLLEMVAFCVVTQSV